MLDVNGKVELWPSTERVTGGVLKCSFSAWSCS